MGFRTRFFVLYISHNNNEMGNFCMGDVGGYGIADYLPRVPFLPKGPVGPAGKKGTRGRQLRNSISTQVTHAEISFISLITSEKNGKLISDWLVKNFFADWSIKKFRTGSDLYFFKKMFRRQRDSIHSPPHVADNCFTTEPWQLLENAA